MLVVGVRGPPDGALENRHVFYKNSWKKVDSSQAYLFWVGRAFVRCARFPLEVALHHLGYAMFLDRVGLHLGHGHWHRQRRHRHRLDLKRESIINISNIERVLEIWIDHFVSPVV